MARLLARLVAMNDGWARPLGDALHRLLGAIYRPLGPVKDLLHGRWLGHPLHGAVTDLPIGIALLAILLDLVGQGQAAQLAVLAAILTMLLAAVTGAADFVDTDGTARTRATLHATAMVVALVLLVVSAIVGTASGGSGGSTVSATGDRTVPLALDVLAFLIIVAGAFVGGDVVYALGNMVSRHAFRGAGTKWIALDTGDVTDLATLPEGTPTKMRAGINDVVVVRIGAAIQVLHAVCAHAGGPLHAGTVTPDGCLQCPWHGARYRLSDGAVRRGPSVYDQPVYDVRQADDGTYEVRRRPVAAPAASS